MIARARDAEIDAALISLDIYHSGSDILGCPRLRLPCLLPPVGLPRPLVRTSLRTFTAYMCGIPRPDDSMCRGLRTAGTAIKSKTDAIAAGPLPLVFFLRSESIRSCCYVSPPCIFDNTNLYHLSRVQTYLSNVLKESTDDSERPVQCKRIKYTDTSVNCLVNDIIQRMAYIKIITFVCFSTLLYLKFLLLWAIVILADFILEFRFEFLWPFWLLLRSVYDSFKYQGLVSVDITLSKSYDRILSHMI